MDFRFDSSSLSWLLRSFFIPWVAMFLGAMAHGQVVAPPAGAHRNISLLSNRIEDSAWPVIHVTSTSGLIMEGNVLPAAPSTRFTPDKQKAVEAVLLENCESNDPAQAKPKPQ